jgi:NAD(P)-dependent dehydrogenase (short-subunit alcohol dehydrogenase family)
MMFRLGRSHTTSTAVVITGASTGIGAACALALDKLGYRVFAGIRDQADGARLTASASPRLMPIGLDVTDVASIAAAVHTVKAMVGEQGLAGLVNNAGIAVAGPVEALPLSEWRRQFEVNIFGLVAVTQAFLPFLRQGYGRIINMGSMSGRAAMPYMAPYSASKHALAGLTTSLRIELQPWGIHVALIEPGAIATPIWGKTKKEVDAWESGWSREMKALYGSAFSKVKEGASKIGAQAPPPGVVVDAVIHALRSRVPKTRYLVGRDTKIRALLVTLLPDRLHDWLICKVIGLRSQE